MFNTEALPSSYSSNTSEEMEGKRYHNSAHQKFLPCWKYLFPWVEIEDSVGNEEKLYCCDCYENDFAIGKLHPAKAGRRNTLDAMQSQATNRGLLHRLVLLLKLPALCLKLPNYLLQRDKQWGCYLMFIS